MSALRSCTARFSGSVSKFVSNNYCLGLSFPCQFSTSNRGTDHAKHYKLVIVGGGSGGTAAAFMFGKKLGSGAVAVIEPSEIHYYQPLWTLVGGGHKLFKDTSRPMRDVLPGGVEWIKDKAVEFHPEKNVVITATGQEVSYDFMVVSMGLQLNYDQIKGLPEALVSDPMVVSNYSPKYVVKTYPAICAFTKGEAIFTFPNTPIKCGGAPQKIMYLAEEHFRKMGKRDKASVTYYTSLGAIFGIKKYAEALSKIALDRNISIVTRHNLIEVRSDQKEAIFENLDTKEKKVVHYDFLHVTPPMSTPDTLRSSPLVDEKGFLAVDKETFQHDKYPNIFGIGDCMNSPNAKSAAAIASQTKVLKVNLSAVMDGQPTGRVKYDGYTSCPLITGKNKCIMAEFDWHGEPMETFPFNQAKERRTMFHFKADIFPRMYWHMLLKGNWHGPKKWRKILHLGRV